MKVLIVGLGNIGVRHLESFKFARTKTKIFIFDKKYSQKAEKFKKDIKINNKNLSIFKLTKLKLSEKIDLCIISTNSNVREYLTSIVLNKISCSYIILEKVVFQTLKSFDHIIKVSAQKNIKIFVNCPRRAMTVFKNIKKKLNNLSDPLHLSYTGSNWGLCSNAIHFVDLFFYFVNYKENYEIKTNLKNRVFNSKRGLYYELKGKVSLKNSNSILTLDDNIKFKNSNLEISKGKLKYNVYYDLKRKSFLMKTNKRMSKKINIPLQSRLTLKFARELIKTGNCGLSSLTESAKYHKIIFQFFKNSFTKLLNKKINHFPIT